MNRHAAIWPTLIALACFLTSCTTPVPTAPPPPAPPVAKGADVNAEIEARLARMSLEEKVGQVMVIGFDGLSLDSGARELIEKYHVGGVIFFGPNVQSPAQIAKITNDMQAAAVAASGVGLL